MPDGVDRRSEDSFGGLDRELRPPGGPRRRNLEGILLDIGAIKKLRRVHRDTIPVIDPLSKWEIRCGATTVASEAMLS